MHANSDLVIAGWNGVLGSDISLLGDSGPLFSFPSLDGMGPLVALVG